MNTTDQRRDPVEQLAEEFAERLLRGERPTLSEYTDRHPELADDIRELFPALVVMERFGSVADARPSSRPPSQSPMTSFGRPSAHAPFGASSAG